MTDDPINFRNRFGGLRRLTEEDLAAQRDTVEADAYVVKPGESQRKACRWPSVAIGYTVIPVLEFLRDKPWDAMAMNYVEAMMPRSLRVVYPGIVVHDDSVPRRMTVYLQDDKRTISRVEMEVDVGLRGCRFGADLRLHR